MAIDRLSFDNVQLAYEGVVKLPNYSGNITVDYSNKAVSGSIILEALPEGLNIPGVTTVTFTKFTIQRIPATPTSTAIFKVTGTASVLGQKVTLEIDYATQMPHLVNSFVRVNDEVIATGFGGDVTSMPVCFVSGTRIATSRGDIAVENLVIGDLALTLSGDPRPIRWIGGRTIDCRSHPRPNEVWPVRISAHALSYNRPARDLFVSPGHAICVDVLGEVLIPAMSLVNGSTIRQDEVETVTYLHIELDSHDILIAENLPAESYLDMGNRSFFRKAAVVDLVAGPDADLARRTHADFCRPFHADGEVVEAVREQLRARAETLGWRQQQDDIADMHLIVDGERIEAARQGLSACFALPADANEIWLMSNATRPCDVAKVNDTRGLGLCLQAITLTDGFEMLAIAPDDDKLEEGFWQVEGAGEQIWRWTNGRARLSAALSANSVGPKLLRIDLARGALPCWAKDSDLSCATKASAPLRLVS